MRLLFFFPLLLFSAAAVAQDARDFDLRPRGGDWTPHTCHLTSPEAIERISSLQQLAKNVTSVTDVLQCSGGFNPDEPCKDQSHCVVDISGSFVGDRDPRAILKDAVQRCNTTVRLGPNVRLNFPRDTFRPLRFGRCVTLTSVNDFNRPTSAARTPRTLGPALNYTEPDTHERASEKTFLKIKCDDTEDPQKIPPSDHIRISGFRLLGPTQDHQLDLDVGISIQRCVDVEISNMEIAGWGRAGILIANSIRDQPPRIKDF